MRLDPEGFAFTSFLERHFETIREEERALARAEYAPWPQREAYSGEWLVFPLVARGVDLGLPDLDLEANRRRCPRTAEVLLSVDRLVLAGFSRLEPGSHIFPHVDGSSPDVVRCQLPLHVPSGSLFRIAEWAGPSTEGRCLVFRGVTEHESVNRGTAPRTVLLADFRFPSLGRGEARRSTERTSSSTSGP